METMSTSFKSSPLARLVGLTLAKSFRLLLQVADIPSYKLCWSFISNFVCVLSRMHKCYQSCPERIRVHTHKHSGRHDAMCIGSFRLSSIIIFISFAMEDFMWHEPDSASRRFMCPYPTIHDGIENECYLCEDYDPAIEYIYCNVSIN